ncbi:MAG: hypothetical protein L3J37_04180 [Rhodobacteraceae bacterium]|nr:hypothetical protein [Paracoccaceae bacterium]
MTAIDKYIRLEAIGWWYEPGRQEAREVIVSFGDATLQLADMKDVPLTHWALRATARIGTRGTAVIYSADPEHHEVLEISDPDMIRAISAVSSALDHRPPPAGRKRWIWRGVALLAALAALSQSPPLIYSMAGLIAPPARMATVSARLQAELIAESGACEGWQGMRALAGFSDALFPEMPPEIIVVNDDSRSFALPASTILLSRQDIQRAATPAELAAIILRAWAQSENGAPKVALISSLGPIGALRYMITGTFPSPLPKLSNIKATGEDYILARDHLIGLGASAATLQAMAKADGIGLPVPQNGFPPFGFPDMETLKNICAE